jgi:hypothetical protein
MSLRDVLCLRGAPYLHNLILTNLNFYQPLPIASESFPRHPPCLSCYFVPSYAFGGYSTYKPVRTSVHSTLVYTTRYCLVLGLICCLLLLSFLYTYAFVNTSTNPSNCSALPLMLRRLAPPTDKTTILSRSSLPRPP